jgi:hypothetical protein
MSAVRTGTWITVTGSSTHPTALDAGAGAGAGR